MLLTSTSEIQDLFPDLDEKYIEECLIAFNGDKEQVIDQLLQGSIPPHLMNSTGSADKTKGEGKNGEESLLSQRRNIFDGDEFDVFSGKSLDVTRVSKGKKK